MMTYAALFESLLLEDTREMQNGVRGRYRKTIDRGFKYGENPHVVSKGDTIQGYTDSEASKTNIIRSIDPRIDALPPNSRLILHPGEAVEYARFHRDLNLNEIRAGEPKKVNSREGNTIYMGWDPTSKHFYLTKYAR